MHIGHVALRVPSLEQSVAHARRTLGLREETPVRSGTRYLSANTKHHELEFIADERGAFDHVGLEVEPPEFAALEQRLVAAGVPIVGGPADDPLLGRYLRCVAPCGISFELYTSMARAQPAVEHQVGRHARKLGHVTFLLRDSKDFVAFLVDILGFRVSDEVGPAHWLRCDSDHHGIAVVSGFPEDRLHHYAFELASWGGMLRYLDDLAVARDEVIYGPGRHGPGYNLFTYTVDPAGCVLEAYADLQRIDDELAYVSQDWSDVPHESNLWGPLAPATFGDHGLPVLGGQVPAVTEAARR
jgi:catechol 2,3-dioxygenase